MYLHQLYSTCQLLSKILLLSSPKFIHCYHYHDWALLFSHRNQFHLLPISPRYPFMSSHLCYSDHIFCSHVVFLVTHWLINVSSPYWLHPNRIEGKITALCIVFSRLLRWEFKLSNKKQLPYLILITQMPCNLLIDWFCLSTYLVSHLIDEGAYEVGISFFPATQALVTRVAPALIQVLILIQKG